MFFANSGAEANEGAVKLARKYGAVKLGGAYEIVTAWNGFHGRTLAMMAASGKKGWDGLFEPKVPGFVRVPFNDLEAMRGAVFQGRTCAVMLEPVQGEAGVFVADAAYLQGVRRLCDERGVQLILDEIQTGIGRTGTLFAYEQYGIEPDIMTLGKGRSAAAFPLPPCWPRTPPAFSSRAIKEEPSALSRWRWPPRMPWSARSSPGNCPGRPRRVAAISCAV